MTRIFFALWVAIVLNGVSAVGQTSKGAIAFRGGRVDVNSIENGMVIRSGPSGDTQSELDHLSEQRQTLESELRYARAKLDASRKRTLVQTDLQRPEQAERAEQSVHEWEARVQSTEAQLAQIDGELQNAIQSAQPSPTETVVVPGETLEVFVVEDTSFNGRYEVRRGGYIILPAVGRISVAGKDIDGAEAAVKKALEASQLRHASVMIERLQGSDVVSGPVVYLSGEFKNPRPFKIPAGTKATLVSCILSAGGVTEKADLAHVKVMRVASNRGVVEEVNVQRILDGSGLASDVTLEQGDVVTIPAGSTKSIFVTGNVKKQGPHPLKSGEKLTAYAAILQSGGFVRFADQKGVYVLRAAPDGTKVKIPVNVSAIQRGHAADVPLQTDDIVVVPEKFFSF